MHKVFIFILMVSSALYGDWAEKTLENLSIQEKVGQLLVVYDFLSHGNGDAFTVDSYTPIAGQMEYDNIPGCTYCHPEVASIGMTEEVAKEKGYDLKIGKFPFRALGKAMATGDTEGFVKVIFDNKYGELLGCHIIGPGATDLIIEAGIARKLETTWDEILLTVHPHPTLSEAFLEATADALKEAIHI